MILDVELAHRMMRRLDVNFSIVRRRADWASRDMPSASLMMTTARRETRERRSARLGFSGRGREGRTLEALASVEVDLLRLGDVLEHLLDDGAVKVAEVAAGGERTSALSSSDGLRAGRTWA